LVHTHTHYYYYYYISIALMLLYIRFIVQEYIMRPLLLNRRKFDIRAYLVIASTAPHFVALYHSGYVRVSLSEFSLELLDDRYVR
jgi:hypothetical protein